MRKSVAKSKRGSSQIYFLIISLIIASVVGAKIIIFSSGQSSSSDYLMNFYAQDIGLLLETMQAVPGDVEILYPLEGGFGIKLRNQYLEIKHIPSGSEKKVYYHVFPQTTIEESTGEELLRFVKIDDVIMISNKRDSASCPVLNSYLDGKDLLVSVFVESPSEQAVLGTDDLELVRSSILSSLDNNGIKTGSSGTLTISITSSLSPDGKNKIRIIRPEATGDNERFLTYFTCSFKDSLAGDESFAYYPFEEVIDGVISADDIPEVTIDFQLTADKKQTFLRNRRIYADSMASVLKPLKKAEDNEKDLKEGVNT